MSFKYYTDHSSIRSDLQDCIQEKDSVFLIKDEKKIRSSVIDRLIYTAVFSDNDELKKTCKKYIFSLSLTLKCYPSSIFPLYMAFGRGDVKGFTVPAINIRTLTYDTARRIFSAAKKINAGAFIIEIAHSEQEYTFQNPDEYSTSILAGAIKEGYEGPVFIQGDHYQFKRDRYFENPEQEMARLKKLIDESMASYFYNIDIDGSTLVNLEKTTLTEQQEHNFTVTSELSHYIWDRQPDGIDVSIGAEIGHIGGKNSTVDEFKAFMEGYKSQIPSNKKGISKISVQTGTSHGGTVLPDGSIADVALDFNVLHEIGRCARETYGLGGAVQHGASTLKRDCFHKFTEMETLEVHLSTEFQNIVYRHAPQDLRNKMDSWIRENCKDEWKNGLSEDQFLYKLRKKVFGPFKKNLWEMPDSDKKPILEALTSEFDFLFNAFNIANTLPIVNKYCYKL